MFEGRVGGESIVKLQSGSRFDQCFSRGEA